MRPASPAGAPTHFRPWWEGEHGIGHTSSWAWSLLLVGAIVWMRWAYYLPAAERSNALVLSGFVVALTGVLVAAFLLLMSLGRRPLARPVDSLAVLLAEAERQWRHAAIERRLLTPAPIPLRWC
jgi:hypothetical protein